MSSFWNYKKLKALKKKQLKEICEKEKILVNASELKEDILQKVRLHFGLYGKTEEKLVSTQLFDPSIRLEYEQLPKLLTITTGWTKDLRKHPLPPFNYQKLENYLINSTDKTYDKLSMKAYKSLLAYRHFEAGHVQEIEYNFYNISNTFCLMRAIVLPSQSTKKVYQTYVVLGKFTGDCYGAWCKCAAGLGEACSHVGALLFALEDFVARGLHELPSSPTSTEMLCKWNRPAKRTVESTPLTDIHVYKPVRGKKPRPKSSLSDNDGRKPCQRSVNEAGFEQLKNKIILHNPHAPWLTLFPSTTTTSACPQVQTDLPDTCMDFDLPHSGEVTVSTSAAQVDKISNTETVTMPESSCSELSPCETLLSKMKSIKDNLCVDDKEWRTIESETREQSRNMEVWNKYRLPRLTASMCKRANIRNTTSPTKAVRDILQYNNCKPTKYIKEGLEAEETIIKMYKEESGYDVQKCGFFVSKASPFLGATPDGIIDDDGCLECKMVNTKGEESLKDASIRKGICKNVGGELTISRNHKYFYQIQQQMYCSERKWCDFVISNGSTEIVTLHVPFDQEFWCLLLPKLSKFYHSFILPELASSRIKNGYKRIEYEALLPEE